MKAKLKDSVLVKAFFHNKRLLCLCLLLAFFYSIMITMLASILGESFDVAISKDIQLFHSLLAKSILIFILVLLIFFLSRVCQKSYYKNILSYVRKEIFNNVINKNLFEILKKDNAYYSSSMISEINMLEQQYFTPITTIANRGIDLIITIYALLKMDIVITIFIIIISFIPILIPNIFMKKIKNKMAIYGESMQNYTMNINEILEGYETFKFYNAEEQILKKHKMMNEKVSRDKKNALRYIEVVSGIANNFALIVVLGSLVVGMFLSILGYLTIGQMFTISFLSMNVLAPISSISNDLPKVRSCREYIEKHIYSLPNSKESERMIGKINECIVIDNLSLELEGKLILNNINLEFHCGKKYFIVGESGSGKSTIVKSILNFFEETKGNIYFDGMSKSILDIDSVYKNITYVSQSSNFFEGSIEENLSFFEDSINSKCMKEAMKEAKIDDVILELSEGLDTFVNNKMETLSGGEKQRVALARALIRQNDFIILDEATSALDAKLFKEVEMSLLNRDITIITIGHRLEEEILKRYDEIIAIKNGEVVEKGNFDELMMENGYFKELFISEN